jgi:hypothetical protein
VDENALHVRCESLRYMMVAVDELISGPTKKILLMYKIGGNEIK